MDLNLNRERINIVKNVLDTTVTQEESLEIIVPDALPDVLRILCTDATVLVRGKETDSGRVSVSGVAAAVVIYAPEDDEAIRKMNLDIPFNISAAEGEITTASKAVIRIFAESTETIVINPRKLAVKVTLRAEISCYNSDELFLCDGAETDEESGVELLREISTVTTPVDVREKPFVISDDLLLPNSAAQISEILKCTAVLSTEEARVVGNKLIFKGNTNISMLYNSVQNELSSVQLSSEFSQIMELESISEEGEFEISLMLTGAYFEVSGTENEENKALGIELHIAAQCVAAKKIQISYIGDVYSTRYTCSQVSEDIHITGVREAGRQNVVYRETMNIETTVAKVISTDVSIGNVEMSHENGTASLKAPLNIVVLYMSDNGKILSATRRFTAEATTDIRSDCVYSVRAEYGKEVYGAPSGNSVELRIPVDFIIMETEQIRLSPITEVSYDEESPIDMTIVPSLTLSRMAEGENLWVLAKRHYSTKTLILSANGMESEEEIPSGQMLIIPKKR